MRIKRAIRLLEIQRDKLKLPGFLPIPWVDETRNYIEQIFGKDSMQYDQICELDFKDEYPKRLPRGKISQNGVPFFDEEDIAAQYIDGYINHLRNLGTPQENSYKGEKLISKKNLWAIIPIILMVSSGVFTFGYYFGHYHYDAELNNLLMDNKDLQIKADSLKQILESTGKESDTIGTK